MSDSATPLPGQTYNDLTGEDKTVKRTLGIHSTITLYKIEGADDFPTVICWDPELEGWVEVEVDHG